MADSPVSSFGLLTGAALAAGDYLPIIDISAVGVNKNKRIYSNIKYKLKKSTKIE
jgi:hypothetical protein